MPAIAIAKTSAPYITTAGSPDRFNAPGSDVAYTLTVTNSGGSPVDLSSLVLTDILPANVTFYNGDYNAGSPGMGPFELTAGIERRHPAGGRPRLFEQQWRDLRLHARGRLRRQCRRGAADALGQHGRQFQLHHPLPRADQLADATPGPARCVGEYPSGKVASISFLKPRRSAQPSRAVTPPCG